ncbi:MAG: hypothetical protein RL033_3879 [Pseudomonadota bacterium]
MLTLSGMLPEGTDAELAQQIAAAEGEAGWAEAALYRRFARRIQLYGLRHLGSPAAAQDLVQQVILRVLEALRAGRLDNPASLPSFVLGTCRNVSWDARRAELRAQKLERGGTEGLPVPQPADGTGLEQAEVLRLFGCMSRLREREARVVRLSFWEERAAEEIGERLGLSAGNVRVIRHRALAQLAQCLEGQGA